MASQHFRFLDLPKELRLMCYERIPITTHHHSVRGITSPSPTLAFSDATIVTKSISCSILTVCRLVHAEANTIFAPRLQHLHASPTRLIAEVGASRFMLQIYKIASHMASQSRSYMSIRNENLLTFLEQSCAVDKPAATTFVVKLAASIARPRIAPREPALVVAITQGSGGLPEDPARHFAMLRRNTVGFVHVCNRRLRAWRQVEGLTCGFSIVLPKSMDLRLAGVTTTHEYVQRDSAKSLYYIRVGEVREEEWKREWEVGEWA